MDQSKDESFLAEIRFKDSHSGHYYSTAIDTQTNKETYNLKLQCAYMQPLSNFFGEKQKLNFLFFS